MKVYLLFMSDKYDQILQGIYADKDQAEATAKANAENAVSELYPDWFVQEEEVIGAGEENAR